MSGITIGSPNEPLEPYEPDPDDFRVERWTAAGEYVVALLRYPNAKTWHDGKKLCVFRADVSQILYAKRIDPHFSEPRTPQTPVARFEPTFWGWEQACELANRLRGLNDCVVLGED